MINNKKGNKNMELVNVILDEIRYFRKELKEIQKDIQEIKTEVVVNKLEIKSNKIKIAAIVSIASFVATTLINYGTKLLN